ncbi:MAG: peptidylprolyl isomerase [Pyrinomonadaceae bacterium]
MLRKYGSGLVLMVVVGALSGLGQTPVPSPTPEKVLEKANARPTPEAPVVVEPFDKANVRTMASKCVRLETEAGDIEIELFPETAPESVRNFLNLTATGLLDTTTFSRVVPGFVVQGGNIWTRTGGVNFEMGARARRTVPDEPSKILHERGIVSMARGEEPNTATTNFFILVSSGSHLDGLFAAYGRVTKGMDVADAINKAPLNTEKPEKPVRIKKASVFSCKSEPPA